MFTFDGFVRAFSFMRFFTEKSRAGKSREQQCDSGERRVEIFIRRFDFEEIDSDATREFAIEFVGSSFYILFL